jgi:hypothetical protein
VTAPPELISTNLETVALMLTVPVVDCPKQARAVANSTMVSRDILNVMSERGIFGFLEGT